MLEKKQG